jgi:ATP-dependent DNA helicase RecQ
MSDFRCPRCGGRLVLRTAKAGSKPGSQFYGCSNYPICRYTIDISAINGSLNRDYIDSDDVNTNYLGSDGEGQDILNKEHLKKQNTSNSYSDNHAINTNDNEKIDDKIAQFTDTESKIKDYPGLPQIINFRSIFQNFQTQIFQSSALPENLVNKIYQDDIDDSFLNLLSQWRVDYPVKERYLSFNEEQNSIISVLKKIYTRGTFTFLSNELEGKLQSLFESLDKNLLNYDSFSKFKKAFMNSKFSTSINDIWLNTEEEKEFYYKILPEILGANYQSFTIPQIEISSLIDKNDSSTNHVRVGFAIFHPELKEKIIVEIGRPLHDKIEQWEEEKDRVLRENGYTVIHISAKEINEKTGDNISLLKSKFSSISSPSKSNLDTNNIDFFNQNAVSYVLACKIVHQIQNTILQAIKSEFLDMSDPSKWVILTDLNESDIFNEELASSIFKNAVIDFIETFKRIAKLYAYKVNDGEPKIGFYENKDDLPSSSSIFISFTGKYKSEIPAFYIQNMYFPFHIACSPFSTNILKNNISNFEQEDIEYFLRYLFRKENFREGQYDAISRILNGKDVLVLLPTGSGKSLIYQLSSFLLPGRTLVVDPIISLMEDQIYNLSINGITRCIGISYHMHNKDDMNEIIEFFGQGEYFFTFVSPERFQNKKFREELRKLTVSMPISMIVIDEAHCVSEWGHDFRTAYLNIGRISRDYCSKEKIIPPLVALTGTASRAVLKDVQRELAIDDFDAIVTPKTFDRPELKYKVLNAKSQEKIDVLSGYLENFLPEYFNITKSNFYQKAGDEAFAGLIFCPHVNGEFGVDEVSKFIKRKCKIKAEFYSGRSPRSMDLKSFNDNKLKVTKEFKKDIIPLLVCTKAFGMGIDKPNIRYTIHYGIPNSIESFYQEAGRAGRNRKTSLCCIIVSNDDPARTKRLLDPNTGIEEIASIIKNAEINYSNDDITRALYFHLNAFHGIEKELQVVRDVLQHFGDLTQRREIILKVSSIESVLTDYSGRNVALEDNSTFDRQKVIIEKAIYRLVILGLISDYTIDYYKKEFNIQYSGASKDDIIENYGKYVSSYLFSRKKVEIEKAMKFYSLEFFDFIIEMANLLLKFIYEVIERGRIRAFNEMFHVCIDKPDDKTIRERILRYLESTKYSEELEELIHDEKIDFNQCYNIFESVNSNNEAAELRGQVARYLESYPDHPSLLMLRALSEAFSKNRNYDVSKQNFLASISSALSNYNIDEDSVYEFASWAISKIYFINKEYAQKFINDITEFSNRKFLRILIKNLPIDITYKIAWSLLGKISENCENLILK